MSLLHSDFSNCAAIRKAECKLTLKSSKVFLLGFNCPCTQAQAISQCKFFIISGNCKQKAFLAAPNCCLTKAFRTGKCIVRTCSAQDLCTCEGASPGFHRRFIPLCWTVNQAGLPGVYRFYSRKCSH